MSSDPVEPVLLSLRGRSAWGLVRTYGSMFFLEIGKPLSRPGDKRIHGEWHFLVELSHWRLDTQESIIVGSDDDQDVIDGSFNRMQLGVIDFVEAEPPSRDLHIAFSSGIRLTTFLASAKTDAEARWTLFGPEDDAWIVNGSGAITHKSAYA